MKTQNDWHTNWMDKTVPMGRRSFAVFYRFGSKLYANITNKCHCSCIFCIRDQTDGVGSAASLWLINEPNFDDMKDAFEFRKDLSDVDEIVFCGYGEPLERAEEVVALAHYIREKSELPLRLNTNGLVHLINPDFDVNKLAIFDSISVSLNADDAEEYLRITRSRFGIESFDAVLRFAKDVQEFSSLSLSVVEGLSPERIEKCRDLAGKMNAPLRVRN